MTHCPPVQEICRFEVAAALEVQRGVLHLRKAGTPHRGAHRSEGKRCQGKQRQAETYFADCYVCGDEEHKVFKCSLRKDKTSKTKNKAAMSENDVALVAKIITPIAMTVMAGGTRAITAVEARDHK